jgi:hypothetical protein
VRATENLTKDVRAWLAYLIVATALDYLGLGPSVDHLVAQLPPALDCYVDSEAKRLIAKFYTVRGGYSER